MDNCILISGAPLWVILGFAAMVMIEFIILGCAYIKECRDKQYYHDKYRALCREHSYLQLNAETKGSGVVVYRDKK